MKADNREFLLSIKRTCRRLEERLSSNRVKISRLAEENEELQKEINAIQTVADMDIEKIKDITGDIREKSLDSFSPQQQRILRALQQFPGGAYTNDLLNSPYLETDNYGSVNTQLNRLKNLGAVISEKVGRKKKYYLSEYVDVD